MNFILPYSIFALIVFIYIVVVAHGDRMKQPSLEEVRLRQIVNVVALLLWPLLLLGVFGTRLGTLPGTCLMATLISVLLAFDVTALRHYEGSFDAYDDCDRIGTRGVQVATLAFALGALLVSQQRHDLSSVVSMPLLLALGLCALDIVPSPATRSNPKTPALWTAIHPASITYAAALLTIAVAVCIDLARERGTRSLVPPNVGCSS